LRFRLGRIERESPILRAYGPLVTEYDSLLARGSRANGEPGILAEISERRDGVDESRKNLLSQYDETLDGGNPSTRILEIFLLNFPEDPRADSLRLQLARAYRLSARYDLAAEKLGHLLEHAPPAGADADSSYSDRARTELLRTFPFVEDPDVCQALYECLPDADLREEARTRLETIADSLSMLEEVGRFVQSYPASPAVERFRTRLNELSEGEFKKGRLHEGLGDRQSALRIYNRIAIFAPGTEWAEESRNGITRIQALAVAGEER
jgi:tetratricopeptide (TPR) repeat protein